MNEDLIHEVAIERPLSGRSELQTVLGSISAKLLENGGKQAALAEPQEWRHSRTTLREFRRFAQTIRTAVA